VTESVSRAEFSVPFHTQRNVTGHFGEIVFSGNRLHWYWQPTHSRKAQNT